MVFDFEDGLCYWTYLPICPITEEPVTVYKFGLYYHLIGNRVLLSIKFELKV